MSILIKDVLRIENRCIIGWKFKK